MTIEVQAHLVACGDGQPSIPGAGSGSFGPSVSAAATAQAASVARAPGQQSPIHRSWTCLLSAIIAVKKNNGALVRLPVVGRRHSRCRRGAGGQRTS